ncbi:MAG: hypothetical protein AB8H47_09555 [Bacteroidia bacterium]
MTSRIEIIAINIKKRKRKRGLVVLSLVALPILIISYLTTARSSKMPASYSEPIPAISTSGIENQQKTLKKESVLAPGSISLTPLENVASAPGSLNKLDEDSLVTEVNVPINPAKPKIKEEIASASPKVEKAINEAGRLYISMPDYIQMPLTRKMDLMRNKAYNPQDKAALRQHIISQFANRSRARVSVVAHNTQSQGETSSYPIGMYLDRLNKNPRVQFRLVEKVSENGSLSGLVVKE